MRFFIWAPDGHLLATQQGQALYGPGWSHLPAGPDRWDLGRMVSLWDSMCLATGRAYELRLVPRQ